MTLERQDDCKHKFSCLDCGAMLPPDLLAVLAAAKRFMHAYDTNPYAEIIERRAKALRSALAKLKLEE